MRYSECKMGLIVKRGMGYLGDDIAFNCKTLEGQTSNKSANVIMVTASRLQYVLGSLFTFTCEVLLVSGRCFKVVIFWSQEGMHYLCRKLRALFYDRHRTHGSYFH